MLILLLATCLAWTDTSIDTPIDTRASHLTVRVYKSGVFSAFAHDHEISAPVADGTVDAEARRVVLHVDTGALQVRDAKVSEKDRAAIQKTMLGPDVLDAERYPKITFESTSVEPAGPGAWTVHGMLTLHGESRLVTVEVAEKAGHYVGSAEINQHDFGINPIRIAGGTVKVKDRVRIEFDVQVAR